MLLSRMNAPFYKRASSRTLIISVLLLGCVAILVGCSRTVLGGYEDSPDGKYRLFVRLFGAVGHAFVDRTGKTILFSINATNNYEHLLFRKEYRVKGSDICWNSTWDKEDNVTVVLYDYRPGVSHFDAMAKAVPTNYICTFVFRRDSKTGTFKEQEQSR